MQVCIIPHPTTQLILIKHIKQCIFEINTAFAHVYPTVQEGCLLFMQYPLFCKTVIDTKTISLKQAKKDFGIYTIGAPVLQDSALIIPCTYEYKSQHITSSFVAANCNAHYGENHSIYHTFIQNTIPQLLAKQNLQPLLCPIYQLAEYQQTNYTFSFFDTVWIKRK